MNLTTRYYKRRITASVGERDQRGTVWSGSGYKRARQYVEKVGTAVMDDLLEKWHIDSRVQ